MTEKLEEQVKDAGMPVWGRITLISIAYFFVTGFFQYIGSLIAAVPLGGSLDAFMNVSVGQKLVIQFFGLIALVLVVYFFRKYVDRRSIASMGFSLKGRGKDILAGFIVPIVIIGGGSLLLNALGYISFENINLEVNSLIISLLIFVIVAFNEEVFFRGYILNNLMTSMNKYIALLVSAVIFAVFHGLNPNLSWLAFLDLIIAGVLLGIAYIFTKNLWFAMTFHLFWNFFQGPILGYQVSGQKSDSLIHIKTYGDKLFSGGEFGFEGSILCTALSLLTILLIMRYYRRMKPAVETCS